MSELPLQRASGELHLRYQARRARGGQQREGRLARAFRGSGRRRRTPVGTLAGGVCERDEQLHGARGRRLPVAGKQHPLHPRRPADSGGGRPTERLDEAVVAAAAGHPALRTESI